MVNIVLLEEWKEGRRKKERRELEGELAVTYSRLKVCFKEVTTIAEKTFMMQDLLEEVEQLEENIKDFKESLHALEQ